jgi:hypothetical protein
MNTTKEYIFKLIDAFKAQQARIVDPNQLAALGFVGVARQLMMAFNHYNSLASRSVSEAEIHPLTGQLNALLNTIQAEITAITAKLDQIDAALLAEMDKKDSSSGWPTSVTAALRGNGLFSAKQPSQPQPLADDQHLDQVKLDI